LGLVATPAGVDRLELREEPVLFYRARPGTTVELVFSIYPTRHR
jgi:hypothetical protein